MTIHKYNEPMQNYAKYLCLLALASLFAVRADVTGCQCELTSAAEMKQRVCSLCAVAEERPAYMSVFFLKDSNPTKPNRMLALPRAHGPGEHLLSSLSAETRAELWSAAIARAQQAWGNDWGIAINGVKNRTQCHMHLHIGKLQGNYEDEKFTVVSGPEEIPVPPDGNGTLVHPAGNKLHVHFEEAPEIWLMR
jgi:diadenosine tetraphosphate (Ap4A) HIT family hydrolase